MGNKLGITSLVFGIIGVITFIFMMIFLPVLESYIYIIRFITWIITGILLSSSSIVAIVCGGLGIKKDDSPGLAIAGLVLGSLCVILLLFPL